MIIAEIFHREWDDIKLQDIASFPKQTLLSLEVNPALVNDISWYKGVPVSLFRYSCFLPINQWKVHMNLIA